MSDGKQPSRSQSSEEQRSRFEERFARAPLVALF